MYRRTGSPFLSSLTFAVGFLPYLIGGTLLGGLVDRVRPRRMVNLADAGSGALVGVMAIPGMPVAALLALLFGVGTLSSLCGGSRNTLVRATVSHAGYVPARSLMKIAGQLAQLGGNAVAGALLVVLGTSGTLLVNAGSFAVSFVLIRVFVTDEPAFAPTGEENLFRDSLAGAGELFRLPEVRRLLLLGWFIPFFSVWPESLAAPYVSEHHGSPQLVGWWLCALPVGLIVGDLLGVRFLSSATQRRIVVAVAAASFVPYLVFALKPSVPVGIALLVGSGLLGLYSLGFDGALRDAIPDQLFGRAMTLSQAGMMTLQGLGFAFAGAVAELTGTAWAIAVSGAAGLGVCLVLRARRNVRSGP